MRRVASLCTLLVALSTLAAPLRAATPTIHSTVRTAVRTGLMGPASARLAAPTPGSVPVIIELANGATPAVLDRLELAGASLRRVDGRPLRYRRFVPARVDAAALTHLSKMSGVVSVALAPVRSPHPMDRSAELIGLAAARGARPALDLLTGKGIVVADLDSNADVYHPQFFRADAGYFDWIDVNDNGRFDPGVDSIDLDRDGTADPTETAKPIIAETLYTFYGTPVPARDVTFDPSMDWLYLDENGNDERDYGAGKGFDDTTPAFGEPIFVPDDVDRNGLLGPGERVARLGSSKFRKVYVHIEYYGNVDHVFERGVDLSSLELDYTGGVFGYGDALHASGVLSIVAGDVALPGRRWVGIAPDADLLLGFEVAQDSSSSITWALGEKPDVMLHETAGWTGYPLDGSDAYSHMVDDSVAQDGVTHTCPMGNTGGSRKHVNLSIAAGAEREVPFDVPDTGTGALYYAQVSLNFRGGQVSGVKLQDPGGKVYDVTGGPGYQALAGGAYLYISRDQSGRGTDFIDLTLYTDPQQASSHPIAVGTWQLQITGAAQDTITLDGYLADNVSGWDTGVAWPVDMATDDRTVGIPAVSDHCIAVGAHTGHPGSATEPWYNLPEGPGEVRGYSGRGPRIDGVQKPDVLAPDNPWSAAPAGVGFPGGDKVPHGAVWPMGGTSGATPHVTGVAALLAQASIRGDDARAAIRSGAVSDQVTGPVPNMVYGWGRLDAARALGVSSEGVPPTLTLVATPSVVLPNSLATITPTAGDPDGDETKLELKWDDGYDGEWDTAYGAVAPRGVKHAEVGRYPYKARVRDAQGRIADAVVWIEVTNELPQPDAGATPEAGSDAGSDAGSSQPQAASSGGGGDDGCGCRAAGAARQRGAAVLGLVAAAWIVGRARRRRSG